VEPHSLFSGVGFLKVKADAFLVTEYALDEHNSDQRPALPPPQRLPGICFLRGHAVTILIALHCPEENGVYGLLVDQPRVPVGQVSLLELPAGMVDSDHHSVAGIAIQEIQEECGISVRLDELFDLTGPLEELQRRDDEACMLPGGLAISPGGCDECCRYFYLEKLVTKQQLDEMQNKLTGLREHGECITLRVIPWDKLWHSGDTKVMVALFLLDQWRRAGLLPSQVGALATPIE
jgi:ADP-sugar diphosphatase